MIISKSRGKANLQDRKKQQQEKKIPTLEELLANRDYVGAITILEFQLKGDTSNLDTRQVYEWLAYCHYHNGDHRKALSIYEQLIQATGDTDGMYVLYAAACYYYMGQYPEADALAQRGPTCPLQTRLLFHVAHRLGSDARLMEYHAALTDAMEDQLSLASVHFLRGHYQEAADVYKRLLLENRDFLALNVYIALCYSKLDYYDVSQEILNTYVSAHPDSALATNFKACNTYRLYQVGKQAELEFKSLAEADRTGTSWQEHPLIKHNLVVFRGGEGALQTLPLLADLIPESKSNLVVHHLRRGDIAEAYKLVKDSVPVTPSEYTLKAVVLATMGQMPADKRKKAGVSVPGTELVKTAQQFYQLVGSSATECDTIPGRQCMASYFFLSKQFDDVMVYMESIKSYLESDDDFLWNFGVAKASLGKYREALESFDKVQSAKIKGEALYSMWVARCHVMTGSGRAAWDVFSRMKTSSESFALLTMLANDFYKLGQFYYAAKAFDMLERLDGNPEHWDGKRGACAGVLQMFLVGKATREQLEEVVMMLQESATKRPQGAQAQKMLQVIMPYAA